MADYDLQLKLPAQPRLLRCVRELLRVYLSEQGLEEDRICSIVLAVDEACSNAIKHSYGGACERPLEISMHFGIEGLEVVIRDCGKPVTPEHTRPPKEQQVDIQSLRPGGLGLKVLYQVFDEVRYERNSEGGNRVVLRLRREKRKGQSAPNQ